MFYRFWLTLSFKIQALQGSDDKDSVKIHWLERFFDGRYVRLYPQSWYGDHICMRVEIYGCIPGNVMLNIWSLCKLKSSKIKKKANVTSIPCLLASKSRNFPGAPNGNFRENICSEDDLRSRIFGAFVVKFLACLPLLRFSNIYKMV